MAIRGIDVSDHQQATYPLTGFDFVVVKATEGTGYTNPKHTAQANRGRDHGLVVGHYHFVRNGSMVAQADYFLKHAAPRQGEFLALDWEDAAVSSADKDAFLKHLKTRAAGHRVVLYCNTDYWLHHDTSSYAADGLWIAQYGVGPGRPHIKADWLIHQYTSSPIDTSVAGFASRAAMATWAGAEPEDKDQPAGHQAPPFPGRSAFRLGHSNAAVTVLGKQLVKRGFAHHHDSNGYQPGPEFTRYDLANVRDFQRSRAELRGDADGYPGPLTWRLLFS